MKYLSYAWLIITNIIALSIAWLLYSIANTSFETIIVSLLLIVYAHIISSSSWIALGILGSSLKSTKQFFYILQILKKNDSAYKAHKALMETLQNMDDYSYDPLETLYFDDEGSKEDLKNVEEEMTTLTIKAYLSGVFTFLIYALAIWKIIMTLL